MESVYNIRRPVYQNYTPLREQPKTFAGETMLRLQRIGSEKGN